ncbi:MAG: transcriptional regulator [Campylobacterota bacterium]|nr:transcriptional regulator [Campylobacterota bacterium]
MKFSLLIAIVDKTKADHAIDIAKENGAGGVTHLNGTGLGLNEQKTFFGLTYERAESVLLFVLEKSTSLKVMKALNRELKLEELGEGIVLTLPVEHLAGITGKQIEQFQQQLKKENIV